MKISASIYSDTKRSLPEVIQDLENHQVDLLHVDCNDDPRVFEDIALIRTLTKLPIDLHLITSEPEKYYDLLRANPVEFLTFQHEDLSAPLQIPADITGKKGIAVITPTSVSIFDGYKDFDFILIMATIPGQSGGLFDTVNFTKIREFKAKYPTKAVHVDGGVNGEVSFILRNLGVRSSVSGSYLFKAASVGQALLNLTQRSIDSHFLVEDFMTPLDHSPVLIADDLSEVNLKNTLQTIETGKVGFCVVTKQDKSFVALISNADVRKALLANVDDLAGLEMKQYCNLTPLSVNSTATVGEMLAIVRSASFPVSYLPVVDSDGKAKGIVTFANLIKGEL
jgi:ribulose-phosphate 3-epimerase